MPPKPSLWKYLLHGNSYARQLRKELGLPNKTTETSPPAKSPAETPQNATATANANNKKKPTVTPPTPAPPHTAARTWTPSQDAKILDGRQRKLTNAAIAAELGGGVTKGEVSARYGELLVLVGARKGQGRGLVEEGVVFAKKGAGEYGGGGSGGEGKKSAGGGAGNANANTNANANANTKTHAFVDLEPDEHFTKPELEMLIDILRYNRNDLPARMQSHLRDMTGKWVPVEHILDKFFEKD